MELLIVTGLSGAGKTRVINALEDIGFYCVDNIPPALLGRLCRSVLLPGGPSRPLRHCDGFPQRKDVP